CDSGKCKTACEKYKQWIQKRRDQWNKLSEKYEGYDENETYGFSPSMYLILNNGDVCSGSVFSKIFNGKEHGDQEPLCSCKDTKVPDTDKSSDTDNPAPNNMKDVYCENNKSFPFLCKQKNFDNTSWTSAKIKDRGNRNYGVYASPRRQKLCLENIWHYSVDKTSLENQLLQVARSEGKWLKQYYFEKAKSGTSTPEELCKALERTYADYRDLILGKDMWNGPPERELEKKLQKIFKNGQYLRELWWDDHKDDVWKALTCNITCQSNTAPSDSTPQFLRWYEEWYEEFCEKRQQFLQDIIDKCSTKKADDKCDNNNDCQQACNKYGDWIKPKGNEWRQQKTKYEKVYENAKEYYDEEFLTTTKDHTTAIKYLENKCKNSSDWKCDKTKVENMDQIVQKIDKEYKERYEPLCTRCRMKDIKEIIDKVTNMKNGNQKKKQQSNLTVDDVCKNKGNIVNCDHVKSDGLIKVPIDPDDKDSKNNRENNGINCGGIPSNEADYIWKHKDGNTYNWVTKLNENIQIPPRRQKLCYNDLEKSNDVDDLKKRLLTAAANEGYNVGIKYPNYKNHYGIKPCRALQYSFNDYKHLIEGVELLETENKGTDLKIKQLVTASSSGSSNSGSTDEQKRKDWWNENKNCVWDVMVCGYNKGKDEANKKNNNGNNVPELNTPQGGGTNGECKIPYDKDNSDQFLSWLEEWYDDYCNIRTKLKSEVESSCKIEEGTFDCKKCDEKCDKYKDYMEKKEKEWKTQEKYYSDKKNGGNTGGKTNGYNSDSAKEYLKSKFPANCDNASSTPPSVNGLEVENNINFFDKKPNYDVDPHCSCKKYNDKEIYKDIVGKGNCEGLKKTAEETSSGKGIKWINSEMPNKEYLTQRGLTKLVHVPPRRQKLCFQGLDKLDVDSDENKLRHHFMKLYIGEGKNLGEYYKEKNDNKTDSAKYAYDVEPCSALKYSFLDLRDIILGHDMVEPSTEDTEKKLKGIFENLKSSHANTSGPKNTNELRKKFWEDNKECFWKAMKCGYKRGNHTDIQNCDQISSGEPIGTDRSDGTHLQFLRWFTEWGENFCKKQAKEYKKLQETCEGYDCKNGDQGKKHQCQQACEKYQNFINQWKSQYLKQSEKYFNVKGIIPNKNMETKAYEYLHSQLKDRCKNGECKCMKDESEKTSSNGIHGGSGGIVIEKHDTHMPASLDEVPEDVKEQCMCASPTHPFNPPAPGGGTTNDASAGNNPGGKSPSQSIPPSSKKQEDKDSPRPGRQNQENTINTKELKPDSSLNCAEQAAFKLKIEATKDIEHIESKLKGNGNGISLTDCMKLDKITTSDSTDYCNYDKSYSDAVKKLNASCKNEGKKRFKLGTEWECNNTRYGNKHVCVPPRRKGMCMEDFKKINQYDVDVNKTFLKSVQNIAKHEGNHIVKELLKKYPCNERVICDAMKYSFADLADIIRGRDILKNRDQQRIEAKLKTIFSNIYNQLDEKEKKKYPYDIDHHKLRSDWWDANRKDVWKAMTCNAPKEAYVYKTTTGDGKIRTSVMQHYCAHNEDPPYDYDYIPQVLRWMTEWSENLCKALNEKKDAMKNVCDKCNLQGSKCSDTSDGDKCRKCKEKCKEYTKFIHDMKSQFSIQENKYKELYTKTENNNIPFTTDNDKHAIEFLKKMNKINDCDVKSPEKYMDKSSHCVHYKFNEKENNKEAYAFKFNPKEYEKQCSCKITNHPLDKCPFKNTNNKVCNTFQPNNRCNKQNFNYDLGNWSSRNVQDFNGKNAGILIPPRRRHLCVSNINTNLTKIKNIDDFKNKIIESAFSEGYFLCNKFKLKDEHTLQAMKYSFYDYGDIIKGTDMMDNSLLDQLRNTLDDVLNKNGSKGQPDDRTKWWEETKTKVWNAMLCGYRKSKNATSNETLDNTWCDVPTEDETPQFLRWLEEWAKLFCNEKVNEAKKVVDECLEKNKIANAKTISNITESTCKDTLQKYKEWYFDRNKQWEGLKKAYKSRYTNSTNPSSGSSELPTNAEKYVQRKCQKCDCKYKDLQEVYERTGDAEKLYKVLIHKAQIDSFDTTKRLFYKIFTIYGLGPDIAKSAFDSAKNIISESAKIGIPAGIVVAKNLHDKIKDVISSFNSSKSNQDPAVPPPQVPPVTPSPTPQDEPDIPINDILSSTLPLGISFSLGSIALLFYMK
ncbi:putative EMP1-like protein, partial [Plasmodium gaboni]